MNNLDKKYFSILKQHITRIFLENNAADASIENWKGETITAFQEDVFLKTKAGVSEKWFYTYLKNHPDKLPRIDMLNILSKYAGYKNWDDFMMQNPVNTDNEPLLKKKKKSFYPLGILTMTIVMIGYFAMPSPNYFEFCFFDEDKNLPITSIPLNITLLHENESPVYLKTDSTGCFNYKSKEKQIKFIVSSPYHQADTILRSIENNENKTVKLKTDDYALMLHYYSNGNKADWQKRKDQLHNIFDDKAIIYRVFKNNIGVEVYSKDDFINQLTIPTNTLKNIEILDKVYKNNKIVKLKFIVK